MIGFSHYSFCPLLWHQLLPCVVFFSVSVVMSCCVFLVSSVIFCPYLSFLSGVKGMTIVFGPNLQVPYRVLSLASRVACPSIYLCLLNAFGLGASAVFSNDNGEPMAVSVRSLVTLFISVFLSVVRLCLPQSPLLAVLWSSWLCFFSLECVSSLSLLPLGRLRWLYCGRFLGFELALLECACLPSRCSPRSPLLVAQWFLFLR